MVDTKSPCTYDSARDDEDSLALCWRGEFLVVGAIVLTLGMADE